MSEDNWMSTLPAELQEAAYFKPGDDGTIKPLEQLVSDLNGAAEHQGNSMRIPGPDAGDDAMGEFHTRVMEKIPGLMLTPNTEDPEAMSAVYGKLGRPKVADSYKVPEGVGIEGEELGALKEMAFKANMTDSQFSNYLTELGAARKLASDQTTLKFEEATTSLKTEWGAAYDQNRAAAISFAKTNSATPPYIVKSLEDGTLPADQVKWLHAMSTAISNEDGEFHKQDNNTETKVTPDEAKLQLEELNAQIHGQNAQANPAYPIWVKKRMKLMEMAYPEG